jgi:hypothetical protein
VIDDERLRSLFREASDQGPGPGLSSDLIVAKGRRAGRRARARIGLGAAACVVAAGAVTPVVQDLARHVSGPRVATRGVSGNPSDSSSRPGEIDVSTDVGLNFRTIKVSGTYQRADGALLDVQVRQQREWRDFGVSTTVSGGWFKTRIVVPGPGDYKFRLYDAANARSSEPIDVTASDGRIDICDADMCSGAIE